MKHKAHAYEFNDLIPLLEKEVKAGYINKIVDEDSDLVIYNYSRNCMTERYWPEACLMARGLVVNPTRIVATPFMKFKNFGEDGVKLPEEEYEVFEKLDGSFAVIFHYNGEWRVNTRGSFNSDQAIWAKAHFDKNVDTKNLKEGNTYLGEIIYISNRIVVQYFGSEFLGLLGGFDSKGIEIPLNEVCEHFGNVSEDGTIRRAKTFKGKTVKDLLYLAENVLTANEEGFVVRFANGYRIKIKGDKYVALHKILSHFSEKGVMEFVRDFPSEDIFANENFNELPEEFFEDLALWNNKYRILFESYLADGLKFVKENKTISNKEVGLKKGAGEIKDNVAEVFFSIKKGKFKDYYKSSLTRQRVFNKLYKTK
tara:strand:- start:2101 stop:3204 length:1104 start_codon:yes stop_codon:yes gene_type:complete